MPCRDVRLSSDELNHLISWTREAGEIALQYFSSIRNPRSKSDQTFLTQADLEVEAFLTTQIRAAFPADNIIAEEGLANKIDQDAANHWIIDPIDGTTAFVQGLPGWAISISLIRHGQPCFGLIYMPLLNDLTYTAGDEAIYCNNHRLHQSVRSSWGHKDFLAVTAAAHHEYKIMTQHTRALGSIATSLAYTARGSAVGAFIPKARLWDLAPGAAILQGAGGTLSYISGQPVDYVELLDGRLAPEPIIASHPQLQRKLRIMIEPI